MTLFIAEISSNHNGNLERCRQSIMAAAAVGCGAVKFQLFRIERLFAPEILQVSANHRQRRRWELPPWFLPELAACAHDHGLQFGCTPFDLEAVDILAPQVDFLKIASYELCWLPLIRHCAATGLPLMISTGMATTTEIQAAASATLESGCHDLTIFHCVSSYPVAPEHCNLAAIDSLRHLINPGAGSAHIRYGWSDHSICPGVVRRAMEHWGAEVVEFHFDLDGQGREFGGGHCWLPQNIAPVINGAATPAKSLCDGEGLIHPDDLQANERLWRADPNDGLRPTLAVRQTWPAAQPESHRLGPRLLMIPAGVGWGHLVRCIALAEALREHHHTSPVFLVPDDSSQTTMLDRHGLPWLKMPPCSGELTAPWLQDLRQRLDELTPTGLNGAVIDSMADPHPLADMLFTMGLPTIILDKPQAPAHTLGIVPSLTWSAPKDSVQLMGGPSFLLIREDVRLLRPAASPTTSKGSVLVTFGGADPARLTESCLQALAESLPDVAVHVVIPPGFSNRQSRLQDIRSLHPNPGIITSAAGLEHLLATAGLVVTALGVTVGEAMCLGVPCAVMGFRPQDEGEIKQLERDGLIASLGQHGDISPQELAARMSKLWHDQPRRVALAGSSWEYCDGRGAIRAAQAIATWLDNKESGSC